MTSTCGQSWRCSSTGADDSVDISNEELYDAMTRSGGQHDRVEVNETSTGVRITRRCGRAAPQIAETRVSEGPVVSRSADQAPAHPQRNAMFSASHRTQTRFAHPATMAVPPQASIATPSTAAASRVPRTRTGGYGFAVGAAAL